MKKPQEKTVGLLKTISGLSSAVYVPRSWPDQLKEKNPTLYEELVEVIKDFNSGGHTKTVFVTARALWRYLRGEDKANSSPKLIDVSDCTFQRFVEGVANGRYK